MAVTDKAAKEQIQFNEEDFSLSTMRGCGTVFMILILALVIILFSGVDLFGRWTIEQALFESSSGVADIRWIVHLVYAITMLIALLPLYIFIKIPRLKATLRLWLLAGVLAFFTVPVKMLPLTSQNQAAITITAALMLVSIILVIQKRKTIKAPEMRKRPHLFGSAFLIGLGLAIPWVLWGSLGSVMDSVLVIIQGIAFAFFIASSAISFYLERTQPREHVVTRGEFAYDGFVLFIFFLIVVTSLSQNGSQLLMALTIPFSGWLVAAFSIAGKEKVNRAMAAVPFIPALLLVMPHLFFDMDELSLVISGADGEVMQWANQAGLFTLVFLAALTIYSLIFFKHIGKLNLPPKWSPILMLLSLGALVVVYFAIGRAGFYGDRLFVILSDQVDVASLSDVTPLELRKEKMYQLLTDKAENSQFELRTKLDRWGIDYTPYYLVNGLEVRGGWLVKSFLKSQPGVDRVLDSPQLRPLPKLTSTQKGDLFVIPEGADWNLQMIRTVEVHEELGITGEGVVIGQTDSGVDGNHPELRDSYRGAETGDDYNWLDPWNDSSSPVDLGGHGTSTLGIEVGKTLGVAPGAQWMGCVNLARNLGNPALYLDCMQFMFAPYPRSGDPFTEGDTTKGADIVNNSWGCPEVEGCDQGVFEPALRALKTAGIFMSAAAGNTGRYGCETVTDPPATSGSAFTVGAVDERRNLSAFSSFGPVSRDGITIYKPNIFAPGEDILLAHPGGSYDFGSGTSFAAPHVSGVVALMWSANPDLIGDIETTTRILMETSRSYSGSIPECENIQYLSQVGILDAFKAVQAAIDLK